MVNKIGNIQLVYLVAAMIILFSCANNSAEVKNKIVRVENSLCSSIVIGKGDSVFFSIQEQMDRYKVPGVSITLIKNDQIEWCKGYGVVNAENKVPVNKNTLFQAGSISKPVTALGALSLVQKNILNLDDNINKYLISWKLPENKYTKDTLVTLRYLLCHGAGINGHMLGAYSQTEKSPTTYQLLEGIPPATKGPVRVIHTPKTEFLYSGGGYLIIQHAMEDAAYQSFKTIMKSNVLEKIGMINSGFFQPLPYDSLKNVASGHDEHGNCYDDKWLTFPNLAEGGLWTTPKELGFFLIEIKKAFNGRSKIISKELAKEMLTVQIGSYGLGFLVNNDGDNITYSHGGDSRGYHNYMYYNVNKGEGVVIMTNGQNGSYLYQDILRAVALIYDWSDLKPRIIEPIDVNKIVLKQLIGDYIFNDIIETHVSIHENRLKMMGGDGRSFDFYPISEFKFIDKNSGWEMHFDVNDLNEVQGVSLFVNGMELKGEKLAADSNYFGQKPPDTIPLLFAPGIISSSVLAISHFFYCDIEVFT